MTLMEDKHTKLRIELTLEEAEILGYMVNEELNRLDKLPEYQEGSDCESCLAYRAMIDRLEKMLP